MTQSRAVDGQKFLSRIDLSVAAARAEIATRILNGEDLSMKQCDAICAGAVLKEINEIFNDIEKASTYRPDEEMLGAFDEAFGLRFC